MKKKILIPILVLILGVVCLFVSCGISFEPVHEHTYSNEWSSDDSYHWISASCSHSEMIKNKSEHTWDDGYIKDGTECSPNATIIYTCTVCNAKRQETGESHSFKLLESKASTCTSDGYDFYICQNCKKEEWVTYQSTGHKITSPTNEKAPTCVEEGYSFGLCEYCQAEATITYSALGHSDLEMNHTGEFCGEVKIGTIKCKTCNEIISQYGHTLVKTISNATCTENGYIKEECLSCDYSVTEILKSQGHISGAWQTESVSTCSTHGTCARYCITCGQLTETNELSLLDHTYSSEIVNGQIVYSCTACSHSYSMVANITNTVSFETNGGSVCESLSVNSGEELYLPSPTKEGFDFGGWYFDKDLTNICPSTLVVTDDTLLYASWNESKIKSANEEKTLFTNVPLDFDFVVVTDIELSDENVNEYVFVKDSKGNAVEIFISSIDGNRYSICSKGYEENTTYEVFILDSLSFEKASSNKMWFITDGVKETSIKFLPHVKHINENEIYSLIQSEDKVYIFLLEDKLDAGDIVVVHGASEEEIVLAMEIVSEGIFEGTYSYEITTASPENVYEEANIFYSGELDISNIELSKTLEEDLVEQLKSSELYAQIEKAAIIFASENSNGEVNYKLKSIKATPKYSISGATLNIQYTVSAKFEKETGGIKQEFSISIVITTKSTFYKDTWFKWVDDFAVVLEVVNEFQIDIFATGSITAEKDISSFKNAFKKAKETGMWEGISTNKASSSSNVPLGTVEIRLHGITVAVDFSNSFEFKATGEIGTSVRVVSNMRFGVKSGQDGQVEMVNASNTNADLTFVIRGGLEFSYTLELKLSVKFVGVFEVYVKVNAGPYLELNGMFVASSSTNGSNGAKLGGHIEAGVKIDLTIGASAKIDQKILWWNVKVVVFDVSHKWNIMKIKLFELGEDEIPLFFESANEQTNANVTCGAKTDITKSISNRVVFQKIDTLSKTTKGRTCKYYLAEGYEGISLSPNGTLTCSFTDFNNGDSKEIKVKVVYGDIFKYTTVTLHFYHREVIVPYAEPTCTEDGNTAYSYCRSCNMILSGELTIFPAFGHDFNDDTVCAICNEGTPLTYQMLTSTTCAITGIDPERCPPEVVIPKKIKGLTVTEIYAAAFQYNTDIVKIVIPDTVTRIGKEAFYDCDSLEEIEIPDSVTEIGANAFWYCSSLKKLTLGNGITTISGETFLFCTSLTNVTIPDSVTTIDSYAFSRCSSLSSVTLGKNLTTIYEDSFYNCGKLVEIYNFSSLDISAEDFGVLVVHTSPDASSIFSTDNNGCIFMSVDDKVYIWDYEGNETELILPNSVTNIGNTAFSGCTSLESIEIPNSVTSIGGSAFYNCAGLRSIVIPNSVTSIGNYAFSGCTSLTNIEIPNSVTEIGDYTFHGCTALSNIVIPNSVTKIGASAFDGCAGLESVTIGDSVTEIGESAFSGCTSLTNITIGDSVTEIGESAFSGCTSLTSITIGDKVTTIGDCAFYNCENLERVILGNSVTSIGSSAFYNCTSLTNVTIPNSVTEIGDYTFHGCTALSNIVIPNSVTKIGASAFDGCAGLESVTIGDSVTEIGESAFSGCTGLTSIEIPNSVTSIGGSAFAGCTSLESVTIGDSVTEIGSYAFYNCTALTSIEIPSSITSIGVDAFSGCESLTYNEYDNAYYIGNTQNPYLVLIKAKNTSITSCKINESTRIIYSDAFFNCKNLESVTICNGVKEIGDEAFALCKNLVSIVIPNSVTEIHGFAFSSCHNLTIYAEAESQPSDWSIDWNYGWCPVYWYSESEPISVGLYWHYVDGQVVIWE